MSAVKWTGYINVADKHRALFATASSGKLTGTVASEASYVRGPIFRRKAPEKNWVVPPLIRCPLKFLQMWLTCRFYTILLT